MFVFCSYGFKDVNIVNLLFQTVKILHVLQKNMYMTCTQTHSPKHNSYFRDLKSHLNHKHMPVYKNPTAPTLMSVSMIYPIWIGPPRLLNRHLAPKRDPTLSHKLCKYLQLKWFIAYPRLSHGRMVPGIRVTALCILSMQSGDVSLRGLSAYAGPCAGLPTRHLGPPVLHCLD